MGTPVREYTVDSDALLDEETAVESTQTDQGPFTVSVSPSPFHVPVMVEITSSGDGSCTFAFLYPNKELPERPWQTLPDDPTVEIECGRYTGKILRVRIKSAMRLLGSGAPQLRLWADSTGVPRATVSQRNAKIISAILANMPDEVRLEVLADLKTLVTQAKQQLTSSH